MDDPKTFTYTPKGTTPQEVRALATFNLFAKIAADRKALTSKVHELILAHEQTPSPEQRSYKVAEEALLLLKVILATKTKKGK